MRQKTDCVVCSEPVYKAQNRMCDNCLVAKAIIQRSVTNMMNLHGVTRARGICVDCGTRPATVREHRKYSQPLNVDFVCGPCNKARGPADDLFDLIKMHRGIDGNGQASEAETAADDYADAVNDESLLPKDLNAYLIAVERDILIRALRLSGNNWTKAAKAVGLTFRQIRYKLHNHGIFKDSPVFQQ